MITLAILAAPRPDSWNFPLFVHVLGAMILVGGLVTAAGSLAFARGPAAAPAAVAEPVRLDPLLDQLARGDSQPLLQKLPGVINRLLPLFRLLTTNQRAQLIQFLQKLG